MELHQLRYFLAVAELRSFTRAAQQCFVAQPSLSQQIIKLERELGQPLFQRRRRDVRLTVAGKALLPQAEAILGALEEVKPLIEAATDPEHGTVTVGAIPTVAPYLLPPLLHQFALAHPSAEIAVVEHLTEFTLRGCLEGELDVGVVALPVAEKRLEVEPLFTEELLLALPPRHRLGRKRQIAVEDLSAEPFVLLNEMHCLGKQILNFCERQGCPLPVRCRGAQLLTVQELVAVGRGVSLVPAMACAADHGKVCTYRSLAGARPTRTLALVWDKRRYHSPLVEQFLEALRSAGQAG
jgi:LysR family hydrogen peroxide-inducible transcriptional activator